MSELDLHKGTCSACEGEGRTRGYTGWDFCSECNGLGVVATNLGDQVQEIVWRKIRSMRREDANE